MNNILFSKKSDNWATPKVVYDRYIAEGYFDPCPLNSNFDGLKIDWEAKNFVNPPYSKIKEFVEKAIEEHKKEKEYIELMLERKEQYIQRLKNYFKRYKDKITTYGYWANR